MSAPDFSLDGRVAVVTGAARGLGKAIASACAAAGAAVVCVDQNGSDNEAVARALEGKAVTLDVTDADAVEAAVDALAQQVGSLDILVNCAGIGGRAPATEYSEQLLGEVLAVNVEGSLYMCQSVGRRMIAAASGSIVNIASIGGLVGYSGSLGYQVSKGAVVQMTRTLAVEWAEHGVRVNAVAPGHIATELVQEMWKTEPELREFFLSRTPMNMLGSPEDVAGPVVFLASDAAAMITGQVVAIDGGYTAQ